MQNGYSSAGINRSRKQTLATVSIVVVLAMIVSFTLAWFAQLLISRNNQILSGEDSASVELWGQTVKTGRFDGEFAKVTGGDLIAAQGTINADGMTTMPGYLIPQKDTVNPQGGQYISNNYLYKIVGPPAGNNPDGLVYNADNTDFNRLLNDTALLPGNVVKRRLVVFNKNSGAQEVSYSLSFPETKDPTDSSKILRYDLAEAIRVDAVKLSKKTADTAVGTAIDSTNFDREAVPAFTGVDLEELQSKSVSGRLLSGEFDIYEFTFTFLHSASNYFETTGESGTSPMNLRLNAKVVAKAGAQTHFVQNVTELQELLTSNSFLDGDTIQISNNANIVTDNFITDKMFNMVIDPGSSLRVTKNFRVIIPPDKNGIPRFGTIDVLYGARSTGDSGTLTIDSGAKLTINAPKVAVRWNNAKNAGGTGYVLSPRQPDNSENSTELNVRVFNGTTALHDGAETYTAISVPAGNFMDDSIVSPATAFMGTGDSEEDPYLIGSAADYKLLMNTVNSNQFYSGKYFLMTADLDFSGSTGVKPIGIGDGNALAETKGNIFAGTFNGAGRDIRNLDIIGTTYITGIFGLVSQGTIKNLNRVGGRTTSLFGGDNSMGGIVGRTGIAISNSIDDGGEVLNCTNTSTVDSNGLAVSHAGGIVGSSVNFSRIIGCYNTGNIINDGNYSGGVAGIITRDVNLIGCFNTGTVSGKRDVGGVLGNLGERSTILNSYNIGHVIYTGTDTTRIPGGICGPANKISTIKNCYYLDNSVGIGNIGTITGVGALTTSGMPLVPDSAGIVSSVTKEQMRGIAQIDGKDFTELLNTGLPEGILPFVKAPEGSDYRYPWLSYQKDLNYEVSVAMFATDGADYATISTASAPLEGDGTENNPYIIDDAETYRWLESKVNAGSTAERDASYKLIANLNFKEVTGTLPIGGNAAAYNVEDQPYFGGSFDGNGKEIRSMNIALPRANIGIFGKTVGARIHDLGNVGGSVYATDNPGGMISGTAGIVGSPQLDTVIENCYNTSTIGGNTSVGGIGGWIGGKVIIRNCYNAGRIENRLGGRGQFGGVLGAFNGRLGSLIENCYNIGAVYAGGEEGCVAGGITSSQALTSYEREIKNCYNAGAVISEGGVPIVGSIVGYFRTSSHMIIKLTNCYYLEGTVGSGKTGAANDLDGAIPDDTNCVKLSQAEMAALDFVGRLNTGLTVPCYKSAPTNALGAAAYPWLLWEKEKSEGKAIETIVSIANQSKTGSLDFSDNTAYPPAASFEEAGTEEDPYLIEDGYDYKKLITDVGGNQHFEGKYFKLINHLNFSGVTGVRPIGAIWTVDYFSGTFDGNYKTLINLNISNPPSAGGIFSAITRGKLMNLGKVGGSITSTSPYAGGLTGLLQGSTMENCFNTGTVQGSDYVGGLVGDMYGENNTVTNCYNSGRVTSQNIAGGISGLSDCNAGYVSTLTNCYNVGKVTGGAGVSGNIISIRYDANAYAVINNCYGLENAVNGNSSALVANTANMTINGGGVCSSEEMQTKGPDLGGAFQNAPYGSVYRYPWLLGQTMDLSNPS